MSRTYGSGAGKILAWLQIDCKGYMVLIYLKIFDLETMKFAILENGEGPG